MAGNKKKYCSKMKLDCEYFFICQKMPDDNLNLKKIKKILSKLDISNILMLKTKRKIIKHEFLTDSQARFFINKYKKLGLKVVVLRYKDNKLHKQPMGVKIIEYKDKKCAYKKDLLNKNNIIVAAKNSDDIQKFIKYENLYYTHPEASICIGAYLGYPKCCIKNHFKKIFTDGNFNELAVDKKWKQLKQEKITCPLVNNRWPLFSHYFCSFKCKETYEIAHEVLHYLAKKYGQTIVPYYFNYVKNLK